MGFHAICSAVISNTWLLCMGLFFAFFVWPVASGLPHALVTLEILHLALMFLGRSAAPERAEVAALAGLGIHLARIEPIFARCELADHGCASCCRGFNGPCPGWFLTHSNP